MTGAPLVALLATGLLIGAVSAVTPFLPVEAYVVSVGLADTVPVALAAAAAAALGQTAGKLVLFTSARAVGRSSWWGRRSRGRAGRGPAAPPGGRGLRAALTRWNAAGLRLLGGRAGGAVVLVSAAAGVPPLLAVAVCAGASPMRRPVFATCCLLGRATRFGALALAPGLL